MLERYTHPTDTRKLDALDSFSTVDGHVLGTQDPGAATAAPESADLLKEFGGRHEARTRDLRVANAALSQLS